MERLAAQMARDGYVLSATQGRSMRPLIWGGVHFVAVVPLEGEPRVGDLLMFRRRPEGREKNIVHRLVAVRGDGEGAVYVTRGDNCLTCEEVRRADIIGRVAEVHRSGGYRPWHAISARRFAVNDRAYQRYARLWAASWPLRRQLYLLRAHTRGVLFRLRRLLGR